MCLHDTQQPTLNRTMSDIQRHCYGNKSRWKLSKKLRFTHCGVVLQITAEEAALKAITIWRKMGQAEVQIHQGISII